VRLDAITELAAADDVTLAIVKVAAMLDMVTV